MCHLGIKVTYIQRNPGFFKYFFERNKPVSTLCLQGSIAFFFIYFPFAKQANSMHLQSNYFLNFDLWHSLENVTRNTKVWTRIKCMFTLELYWKFILQKEVHKPVKHHAAQCFSVAPFIHKSLQVLKRTEWIWLHITTYESGMCHYQYFRSSETKKPLCIQIPFAKVTQGVYGWIKQGIRIDTNLWYLVRPLSFFFSFYHYLLFLKNYYLLFVYFKAQIK